MGVNGLNNELLCRNKELAIIFRKFFSRGAAGFRCQSEFMSSTVRHLVMDSKPVNPATAPHNFRLAPLSGTELADQKLAFDLRRSLKMTEDSQRLHLNEIQKMLPTEKKTTHTFKPPALSS